MTAQIAIVDEPTPEDRAIILAELLEHNQRNGPPDNEKLIAILLKGEDGAAVGGLWGRVVYDWLFVELLAVPESMRGSNHGAALMGKAEELARVHECIGVWLDTFAFQARGFYERIGYSVFGTIEDHPIGSARYFMSKRF